MTNLYNITNVIGLILCVTTSLLTFSRGGILAIVLVIFVYVCMSSFAKKVKIIMGLVLFSVVIFSLANVVMGGQLDDILNGRISDFSRDNGSGRFTLWEAAFKYFYLIHISVSVLLIFRVIMSISSMKNYMCTIHF